MSLRRIEGNPFPPRLVDSWRLDVPSEAELRRGFSRFLRSSPHRNGKLLFGLIGVGVLLGVGLAQAATSLHARWSHHQELTLQSAVAAPISKPVPQLASAVSSAQEPTASPAARSSQSTTGSTSTPLLGAATSKAGHGSVQLQWQRAAEALRDDDFERAQAALLDIERSAGGPERDAARLARAQLLASHQRGAQALDLARAVAQGAAFSTTRERAAALVQRLTKTDEQDRSRIPAPAINRP